MKLKLLNKLNGVRLLLVLLTVSIIFFVFFNSRLVLKKLEAKESLVTRLINKVKGKLRSSKVEDGGAGKAAAAEPVVVEENPIYEDREELEDIMEEEEEEEEDKDSCKPSEGDSRKQKR